MGAYGLFKPRQTTREGVFGAMRGLHEKKKKETSFEKERIETKMRNPPAERGVSVLGQTQKTKN